MPNLVRVSYRHTGASTNTDALGMREMQAKAFAARESQYLLLKAPPASGKSRVLMFLALDKLFKQGLKKVIVAVPERSIGAYFASTNLTDAGFFADWDQFRGVFQRRPEACEQLLHRVGPRGSRDLDSEDRLVDPPRDRYGPATAHPPRRCPPRGRCRSS